MCRYFYTTFGRFGIGWCASGRGIFFLILNSNYNFMLLMCRFMTCKKSWMVLFLDTFFYFDGLKRDVLEEKLTLT